VPTWNTDAPRGAGRDRFEIRIPYGSKTMTLLVDDHGHDGFDSACWLDVVLVK
jgi:hypothetical protein